MRKVIKTKEQAQEILDKLGSSLDIVSYGGTVTSKSLFRSASHDFESTLHTVTKALKKGTVPGVKSTPKVSTPVRDLEKELTEWLQVHVPDAVLVHFSGDYSTPSVFLRQGYQFTISVNRLKDKARRGLQVLPLKEETVARRISTLKKSGTILQVNGKTLKEHAQELGVAYSTFQSTLKHQGLDAALALSPQRSSLETLFEGWYPEAISNRKLGSYRPDFRFEEQKLIVECDGLYWHSDAVLSDTEYHRKKKEAYTELGYKSLFFRSDEFKDSPEIVKSIVDYHLGNSQRVFARKLDVKLLTKEESKQFFKQNHLMGSGQGKTLALHKDGEVFCALQYRRCPGRLDISRYCNLIGYTVVGGFSKLLSYLPNQPIGTYVDLRYGTGSHLASLGFVPQPFKPSFRWTDGRVTFHRLRYRKDTGYDNGLYKIWDCGQQLYLKPAR